MTRDNADTEAPVPYAFVYRMPPLKDGEPHDGAHLAICPTCDWSSEMCDKDEAAEQAVEHNEQVHQDDGSPIQEGS